MDVIQPSNEPYLLRRRVDTHRELSGPYDVSVHRIKREDLIVFRYEVNHTVSNDWWRPCSLRSRTNNGSNIGGSCRDWENPVDAQRFCILIRDQGLWIVILTHVVSVGLQPIRASQRSRSVRRRRNTGRPVEPD